MAEQPSSPTFTRRLLNRLNKSIGKQPFRYQVEVVPAIVGGLPPSIESVSVTMERGAKVSYTDPAIVDRSSRAAKFLFTMKQTTTMYLEGGVFAPKEYVLKVKSHSASDPSRPARTIGRTRLDLASFCTPSTQYYSEELMVALKPSGCITLHISTQLLGDAGSETNTPRAHEISELSFTSGGPLDAGDITPHKLIGRTQSVTGDVAAFGGSRVGSVAGSRPVSRQGSVTTLRKSSASALRRSDTDFADESYPAFKDTSPCASPQPTPRTNSVTAIRHSAPDFDLPGPGPASRKQQRPNTATSPRSRSPLGGADSCSTPPLSPRSPSPRATQQQQQAPAPAPDPSPLSVHRRAQSVTFGSRNSDAVVRSRLLTLVAVASAEQAAAAEAQQEAPPSPGAVGRRTGSMTALSDAGGAGRVNSTVAAPRRSASVAVAGSHVVGSWSGVDVASLKEGVDTLRTDSDTIKASHLVSRGCSALGPAPVDLSDQSVKQRANQAASSADLAASIDNENSIRAVRALARHLLHERDDWRDRCRAAEAALQAEQERARHLQERLEEASVRAAAAEASLTHLQEAPLVRCLVEAKVALAQADLSLLDLQGQLSQERRTTRQLSARLLSASAHCEWTDSDDDDGHWGPGYSGGGGGHRGGAGLCGGVGTTTPEPMQQRARPRTAGPGDGRGGDRARSLMTAPGGGSSMYAPRVARATG